MKCQTQNYFTKNDLNCLKILHERKAEDLQEKRAEVSRVARSKVTEKNNYFHSLFIYFSMT